MIVKNSAKMYCVRIVSAKIFNNASVNRASMFHFNPSFVKNSFHSIIHLILSLHTSTLENRFINSRCNSWESSPRPAISIQKESSPPRYEPSTPEAMKILRMGYAKQRSCSCSSQTEANSFDSDTTDNCNNSLNPAMQVSTTGSISSDCEDLQAYVKEMTKELATEIKSEIREVISKVEDVLENTECLDSSQLNLAMIDSVSATDVAEYLKECSKEITSEVQSEIREMVNAVDEFISPVERQDSTGSCDKKIYPTRESS